MVLNDINQKTVIDFKSIKIIYQIKLIKHPKILEWTSSLSMLSSVQLLIDTAKRFTEVAVSLVETSPFSLSVVFRVQREFSFPGDRSHSKTSKFDFCFQKQPSRGVL